MKKTIPSEDLRAKFFSGKDIVIENTPTDIATPVGDVVTSHTDVTPAINSINKTELLEIITKLSSASISTFGTPVRLNSKEKKEIEDFIHNKLRNKGVDVKGISMGKLMRYALRYMIKVEEKAFAECLIEALKRSDDID